MYSCGLLKRFYAPVQVRAALGASPFDRRFRRLPVSPIAQCKATKGTPALSQLSFLASAMQAGAKLDAGITSRAGTITLFRKSGNQFEIRKSAEHALRWIQSVRILRQLVTRVHLRLSGVRALDSTLRVPDLDNPHPAAPPLISYKNCPK